MDLNKKVLVLGGGESGVGAAILAKKKKYDVFLSDHGSISENYKSELRNMDISFEEKGHNIDNLESYNLIVKSPGIPRQVKILQEADLLNVPVWSEIEFGYHHCDSKIIGITGSNGKTTTSVLTYQLLRTGGIDVEIGGNYGKSFCRLLFQERQYDWYVLELSSFQLEDIFSFKPDIAVLLNITPDHLDRYEYDILSYGNTKLNIIKNQKADDYFIYNKQDEITIRLLKDKKRSMQEIQIDSIAYEDGIYSKELDTNFNVRLYGKHNLFNAYCAITIARIMGISDSTIGLGLKLFKNDPHRLEKVVSIDGVVFINDSKATNVDAVYYALEGLESNIIWLAGGTDKGNDYSVLFELVKKKVKALICIGIDNQKLKEAFHDKVQNLMEVTDIQKAVILAFEWADPGDTVLLSPACASFDLYKNYMDRGDRFKDAVWSVAKN